jgi:hypothetical protein
LRNSFRRRRFNSKARAGTFTDYARKGSVAEKVEKELSSVDSGSDKPAGGDKDKAKKTPAKKTDKA